MKAVLSTLLALSILNDNSFANIFPGFLSDTTKIIHSLDGITAEWPTEKFKIDNDSKIQYAIDNDQQTVFFVLCIANKETQRKIMQQGMNLYVDIKEKKKENRGVEFPIKPENRVDITKGFANMKLFGFANNELQDIRAEGSINIAVTWDSAYSMNIEYHIPLKMLDGSISSLNNKSIGIGWKINEIEVISSNSTAQPASVSSSIQGRPAGRTNSANRGAGSSRNDPTRQTTPGGTKAQTFWAIHTISF